MRRYAAIRRDGSAKKGRGALAVFVADHGIAEEGVSAFPKAVTLEMLRNIAAGGAAISVLARRFGYELRVVDMGVEADTSAEPFSRSDLPSHRSGHAEFSEGQRDDARRGAPRHRGRHRGRTRVRGLRRDTHRHRRDGNRQQHLGGGGDFRGDRNSAGAIGRTRNRPRRLRDGSTRSTSSSARWRCIATALGDGLEILAAVGGFEIAAMAGVCLGGAAANVPVVVDGFIATAAATAANQNFPATHRASVLRSSLRRRRPSRGARMAWRAADSGSRDAPRRRHRRGARDVDDRGGARFVSSDGDLSERGRVGKNPVTMPEEDSSAESARGEESSSSSGSRSAFSPSFRSRSSPPMNPMSRHRWRGFR